MFTFSAAFFDDASVLPSHSRRSEWEEVRVFRRSDPGAPSLLGGPSPTNQVGIPHSFERQFELPFFYDCFKQVIARRGDIGKLRSVAYLVEFCAATVLITESVISFGSH